jgi:hypothetical protein
VDAVYLGNCVCLLLGVGLGSDDLCYRADGEVMERHGLGESDLERIGVEMMTELKRVEEIFSNDNSPNRSTVLS